MSNGMRSCAQGVRGIIQSCFLCTSLVSHKPGSLKDALIRDRAPRFILIKNARFILSALFVALTFMPTAFAGTPFYYGTTPTDVVEGTNQYSISTTYGTANYLGPLPEDACKRAIGQIPGGGYSYNSVVDLGGMTFTTITGRATTITITAKCWTRVVIL
jgi:hypothetical protein